MACRVYYTRYTLPGIVTFKASDGHRLVDFFLLETSAPFEWTQATGKRSSLEKAQQIKRINWVRQTEWSINGYGVRTIIVLRWRLLMANYKKL